MANSLPNIIYKGDVVKTVGSRDSKTDIITFSKDKEYFCLTEVYVAYVKAIEKMCRKHPDYNKYVNYVTDVIGINFCQVSSGISKSDAEIEMHHGPLFNLFDYASVILNYFIDTNKKISTFRITDKLLQEHYDLNVQTVMLAVTNHEAVHNRDLFLNIGQGFGNFGGFIERYHHHFSEEQKYRILKYIDICESVDSFDNHLFDNEKIKKLIIKY